MLTAYALEGRDGCEEILPWLLELNRERAAGTG
jgi:hypothetical protein